MAFDLKLLTPQDWDYIRSQLGLGDEAAPAREHIETFVDQAAEDDPLALHLKHEILTSLVQTVAGPHLSAIHTPTDPEPMLLRLAKLLAHGEKGPYQANRLINFFRSLPEGTAVEDTFDGKGKKIGQNIIRRVFKTGEKDNEKIYVIGRYGKGVFVCQADATRITFTLTHDLLPNPLDLMDDRKIPKANLLQFLGRLNYYEMQTLRDSGHSYFTHPQYGPVLLFNVHENVTQDLPYLLPNPLDPRVGIPFDTLAMTVEDPWDPQNLPAELTTLDSSEGALFNLATTKLAAKHLIGYSFDDFIKVFEHEVGLGLIHHRDAQGRLYWATEAKLKTGPDMKTLSIFRWDPASQKIAYAPIIPNKGNKLQDWLDGLLSPEKAEEFMQATNFNEIEQHNGYPYFKQTKNIWWFFIKEKGQPTEPGYYRLYGGSPQLGGFTSNYSEGQTLVYVPVLMGLRERKKSPNTRTASPAEINELQVVASLISHQYRPHNSGNLAQWILDLPPSEVVLDNWYGSKQIRYYWSVIKLVKDIIGLSIYRVDPGAQNPISLHIVHAQDEAADILTSRTQTRNEKSRFLGSLPYLPIIKAGDHSFIRHPELGNLLQSQSEAGVPTTTFLPEDPKFNKFFHPDDSRDTLLPHPIFSVEGFQAARERVQSVFILNGEKAIAIFGEYKNEALILTMQRGKIGLRLVRNTSRVQALLNHIAQGTPLDLPTQKVLHKITPIPLEQILKPDRAIQDEEGNVWSTKIKGQEITVIMKPDIGENYIGLFAYRENNFLNLILKTRTPLYSKIVFTMDGVDVTGLLLTQNKPGLIEYGLLIPLPTGHLLWMRITPAMAAKLNSHPKDAALLNELQEISPVILEPLPGEEGIYHNNNSFRIRLADKNIYFFQAGKEDVYDDWSFHTPTSKEKPFLTKDQLQKMQPGEVNVREFTFSNGESRLFLQLNSPYALGFVSSDNAEIAIHLITRKLDGEFLVHEEDIQDQAALKIVISENGQLKRGRYPLPGLPNIYLAVDPQGLSIVEIVSELIERTYQFVLPGVVQQSHSFFIPDPFEKLEALTKQIALARPQNLSLPLAVNDQPFADNTYPIRIKFVKKGTSEKVTTGDIRRNKIQIDNVEAMLQFGGETASRIFYQVAFEGKNFVLTPLSDKTAAGNLVFSTNAEGQNFLQVKDSDSPLAQFLNTGLYGPTLEAHLAKDNEDYYKLFFKGSHDANGELLAKLATLWIKNDEFDKAQLPKEAQWEITVDIAISKLAEFEPLIQKTIELYQASIDISRTPVLTIVSEPRPAKVKPLKVLPPESSKIIIDLPTYEGVAKRSLEARFTRPDKDSTWALEALNYQGEDLLTTKKDGFKLTKTDGTHFELMARLEKGWEIFKIIITLDDPAQVTTADETYISRDSRISAHAVPSTQGDRGAFEFEILDNPETHTPEIISVKLPAVLGQTKCLTQLPLAHKLPLTLRLTNDYLGEFEISFGDSFTWPETEFDSTLIIDKETPLLELESFGGKTFNIPLKAIGNDRFILEGEALEKYNQWLRLTGHPALEKASYDVIQNKDQIVFKKTYQNIDRSYTPKNFPGHAGNIELSPFFHANDWHLNPGDTFLPSTKTIMALRDVYLAARKGKGYLEPGSSLGFTYDMFLPNGFSLSLPIRVATRSNTPFKLEAYGDIKLNTAGMPLTDVTGKPIVDGPRVGVFINSPTFNHQWVSDQSLAAFDNGGNWRITIATPTGVHYLTMVRHPLAPALMAFVDTTEVEGRGNEKEREALIATTKNKLSNHVNSTLSGDPQFPTPYVMSGFEINPDTNEVTYKGLRGDKQLSINGFRYESDEIVIPPVLTLKIVGKYGANTYQVQISNIEDQPHLLSVRVIEASGRLSETYIWDRHLNIFYTANSTFDEMRVTGESDIQRRLTANGFPIREIKPQPKTGEASPNTDQIEYSLQTDQPLSILPDSLRGYKLPKHIEKLADPKQLEAFLKTFSLHDMVLRPSETDAITQVYNLETQKLMSFASQSGVILQLPMREIPDSPHNYTVDWDAQSGKYLVGARLLVPHPDKKGSYIEISVSSVETIKSGSAPAEVTLNFCDLPKVSLKLIRVESKDTHTGRPLIGYHLVTSKKDSRLNSNNIQAELKSWGSYLRLDKAPDLLERDATTGTSGLELADGSLLDLTLAKNGATLLLNNLTRIAADGLKAAKTVINGLTNTGEELILELVRNDEESRILYARNSINNSLDYFVLSRDGTLRVWNRPEHISDFMSPPSSVDFAMRGILGEPYGKKGSQITDNAGDDKEVRSVATRLQLTDAFEAVQKFEITALMGRWKGATPTSFTPDSKDKISRLRFEISVNEQGQLSVSPGTIRDIEIENETKFLWGKDCKIDIKEDEWINDKGEIAKGRVRVVFYHPANGLAPYGWMEFANREALIGAAQNFSVDLAHHHEAAGYVDKKLFPADRGYLTQRAGVAIKKNHDFTQMFDSLGEPGKNLIDALKKTAAKHVDIPALVEVLQKLKHHGKLTDIFNHLGIIKEDLLREIAQFGLDLNPPPQSGSHPANGDTPHKAVRASGMAAKASKPAAAASNNAVNMDQWVQARPGRTLPPHDRIVADDNLLEPNADAELIDTPETFSPASEASDTVFEGGKLLVLPSIGMTSPAIGMNLLLAR